MKYIKLLSVVTATVLTVGAMAVCSQSVSAGITDNEAVGYSGGTDHDAYDATGHCEDWAYYTLKQDSNYCKDNQTFSGFLSGTHTMRFTAPEDLEIVSFKFTLYHETPSVSLKDYTPFTEMDCTVQNDMRMLTGSFAGASPVTVKKGEALLSADVSVNMGDSGYFSMDGMKTPVYFAVDELQVKTADGYRVIIGDENTTQPAAEPGGTTDCCPTVPDASSYPSVTTEPPVASSSPAEPSSSASESVIGDVTGDGSVTISDVTMIQRYVADLTSFTPSQLTAADTNGDGGITIADATQIQLYIAQLLDRLG